MTAGFFFGGALKKTAKDVSLSNGKAWAEYIDKMKIYTPEETFSLMTEAGFAQTEIRMTKSERVCVIGRNDEINNTTKTFIRDLILNPPKTFKTNTNQ